MADKDDSTAAASAEKAFAAASEAESAPPEPETMPVTAEAVEPAKSPESEAVTESVVEENKPEVVAAPAVEPAPASVAKKPAPKAAAKPKAPAKAKPITVKATPKAKAAPKPRKTPAKAAASKPTPKTPPAKPAPAKKPATSIAAKIPSVSQIKEKTMSKTSELSEGLHKVMTGSQEKAKAAFEKGKAVFGEASEFTKGNVEAMVESGKIFASGVQTMGSDFVADSKEAMETMTSDVKELAAVKSPTDFVKTQTEIMRRNFDTAMAKGSKNSEAMLKLASDTFAPISARFSLAIEKVKKAA
ncbi:MAG: phasin family protein [Novosphingobium sp.]|nr:phasin family protein [Novosphingobium sp.]